MSNSETRNPTLKTPEVFPVCPGTMFDGSKHELTRIGQRSFDLPFVEGAKLVVVVLFCAKCFHTLATHTLGLMQAERSGVQLAGGNLAQSILEKMRKS